jgi:transposase
MEVVHARCAGLDVHQKSVVACVRIAEGGQVRTEVRSFGTTTGALYELSDWLSASAVTAVVMEATGVYWRPVWHVLEESFALTLANAKHVKNVPGRKTDVNDATWLAELHAHGLIRGSFVPPRVVLELREMTRARKQLVQERVRHVQRVQKVLEGANVKLSSFVSNVVGTSGRAMLEAMIAGESDPEALASLAHPRLQASRAELIEALRGRVTNHHRVMLRLHLDQLDATERAISTIEGHVEAALGSFREARDLLVTIPGVSTAVATAIVAEIGTDMTRFPTPGHLLSWAGLCPRSDESAGKRRSTRIRQGAPWLKPMLVQAAWAAVRVKSAYERAHFFRLKGRRGPGRAIIAVAASMLGAIWHMLHDRAPYRDLGPQHFEGRDRERLARGLVRRLNTLGYAVTLPAAA